MKKLYMCVTRDKYELPIAVADSTRELGEMVGVDPASIRLALYLLRRGDRKKSIYREVVVDDD